MKINLHILVFLSLTVLLFFESSCRKESELDSNKTTPEVDTIIYSFNDKDRSFIPYITEKRPKLYRFFRTKFGDTLLFYERWVDSGYATIMSYSQNMVLQKIEFRQFYDLTYWDDYGYSFDIRINKLDSNHGWWVWFQIAGMESGIYESNFNSKDTIFTNFDSLNIGGNVFADVIRAKWYDIRTFQLLGIDHFNKSEGVICISDTKNDSIYLLK